MSSYIYTTAEHRFLAHAHLHMMMVAQKYSDGWWMTHKSAKKWLDVRGDTTKILEEDG